MYSTNNTIYPGRQDTFRMPSPSSCLSGFLLKGEAMIVFRNQFHRSERVSYLRVGAKVNAEQYRAVVKDLCGREGCRCVKFTGRYSLEPADGSLDLFEVVDHKQAERSGIDYNDTRRNV